MMTLSPGRHSYMYIKIGEPKVASLVNFGHFSVLRTSIVCVCGVITLAFTQKTFLVPPLLRDLEIDVFLFLALILYGVSMY